MTKDNDSGTKVADRWKNLHRGWKILAAALVLLLLYTAFGFLVAPSIIQSKLSSSLESSLGRPVRVGEVSFNPFSLQMDVQGVNIARKQAEGPLVALESLHLEVEYFSIVEWAVVLGNVSLVSPEFHVVYQEDGTYNISDLMSRGEGEPAKAEEGGVFPFVLQSFAIENGTVVFEDHSLNKTHRIEKLNLNIPFASTLPEDSAEPVKPSLSATINGTPVKLKGNALPFAEPLSAEFNIDIQGSDLTYYWDYAPLPASVKLKSGELSADAVLGFEQGGNILPRLYLRGDYSLENVAMTGSNGAEILSFKSLDITLKEVGIFDRAIRTETLKLESPRAVITRLGDGGIDWLAYIPVVPSEEDVLTEEQQDETTNATRENDTQETRPSVQLETDLLEIVDGRVEFRDEAVPGGFEYVLAPINITAENVNTADDEPARLTANLGGGDKGALAVNATFGILPLQAQGVAEIRGLDPKPFRPYYAKAFPLVLQKGKLDGEMEFVAPEEDLAASRVEGFSFNLIDAALAVSEDAEAQIEAPKLGIRGGPVNPSKRIVTIDTVSAEQAVVRLKRGEDGEIDLLAAFAGQENEEPKAQPETDSGKTAWDMAIKTVNITEAGILFTDNAAPRQGRIEIRNLNAELQDFRPEKGHESPVAVTAELAEGGRFSFDGRFVMPGSAEGDLTLDRLSLQPAQLYIPEASTLNIAGGTLTAQGRIEAGSGDSVFSYSGRAGLSELLLQEDGGGEKIMSVAAIDVSDMRIQASPLSIRIGDISISGAEAQYVASRDQGTNFSRALEGFGGGSDQPEETGGGLETLAIGSVRLENGRFKYVDRGVEPTFDTVIEPLDATIEGLALAGGEKSQIEIDAVIGGDSPLKAQGTLNIMEAGASTDLQVNLDNADLPELTPYSVKYIGYPLVKGKLYADVRLTIQDKVLDAQNHFRLEQLEVGDKVESDTAADVPIKLAMSLLTDSSGTMTLDVPVRGRIDDPQFSLGKIIFKAIASLVGKIVTAPFSFIGAIFGGSDAPENVGVLQFVPGENELNAGHQRKLDAIAKLMANRPGIRLEISGYSAPEADTAALKQDGVQTLVRRQKSGGVTEDLDQVTVSQEEYPEYLASVYRETLDKDPDGMSIQAMEEELRQFVGVSNDDLRELARMRSVAVRDYLTETQGVDPGRIFIKGQDFAAEPKEEETARPRVELGLTG